MHLRKNQQGNMDPLLIPLIVSVILVIGLAGFGIWSYMQFLDQRDNVDAIVATAVTEAEAAQAEELDAEFKEKEKNPYRTWVSNASIGSIEIKYPKTWSGYVDQEEGSSKPLDAYFHPKEVPADENTRYAVRIFVDENEFAKEVSDYDKDIEKGLVTSSPFKKDGVSGTRFDGQIDKDYKGSLVIFPLRDKTVRVWTESDSFINDFNNIILESLTFEK